MNDRDELMREIAESIAEQATHRLGKARDKGKQLRAWGRVFDAVLSGIIAYDEIVTARAVRARATVCDN
jgi:hypothetical protein